MKTRCPSTAQAPQEAAEHAPHRALPHALGHDRQRVGEVPADDLGGLRTEGQGGDERSRGGSAALSHRQEARAAASPNTSPHESARAPRRTIKKKQKPMAQSSFSRARLFLARSVACVAAACSMASSRLADAALPGGRASLGDASKLSPKEPDASAILAAARHGAQAAEKSDSS